MSSSRTDATWIRLTRDVLDGAEVDDFVRDPVCGAVNLFVGTTRKFTDGRETDVLEYDAYEPMAVQEMERLATEAIQSLGASRVAIHHRLGIVPVKEASVVIGVSSPHRGAAFDACRHLIDTLKTHVPIWKRERYTDGSTEWVEGKLPGPESAGRSEETHGGTTSSSVG